MIFRGKLRKTVSFRGSNFWKLKSWKYPEVSHDLWRFFGDLVLLMVQKSWRSPVEVGSLSHYYLGFQHHPRWCRISEQSTVSLTKYFTVTVIPFCCEEWGGSNDEQKVDSRLVKENTILGIIPQEKGILVALPSTVKHLPPATH